MDLPASYYGNIDKRNPVVLAFERDINSVITVMRRAASSTMQDNGSYAKGMKILVEIWIKYKPRLPSKLYQERILQTADILFEIKLYQVALWHGYNLHLLQFNSVKITDIRDVDQFMDCFFPDGFDADQDIFAMKIRAMQGYALCIFEHEKRHSFLSKKGLCKLLRVLNFIRIMMQAFHQHEHFCWQIYNGSLHVYTICRYLMTMNYSAQALEYLLWASISLELSIPLMTAKYLPWLVTLYCAVCHCYYDNQATVQAEEFARRALGKINELAKLEEQSEVPATRETQRVYKEASIKLSAMMFKRAVFETRKRSKPLFRVRPKSTLREIHTIVPWPHTATERMLMGLFESSSAHFFGIIEALWDSTRHPLQTTMPDEPELQEVILELLSAGISILSGVATSSEQKCNRQPCVSLSAVTSTSSLIDLAIAGENKVPVMSTVRFIKLLFQYKQPEAFTELAREMLQVLSGMEGQSFRKAERELTLLCSFNSLLSSQKNHPKDSSVIEDRHKHLFSMSDEFSGLIETLHKSVCGSASDVQPDGDLVLDVLLFLWGKVKVLMQKENPAFIHYAEKIDHYKWLWCLSVLCDVAFDCDLVSVDCTMTAEMIIMMTNLLENTAKNCEHCCQAHEEDGDGMKPSYFYFLESSSTELLKKACEVVERGIKALTKGVATLFPQDGAAITDSAFIQKFCPFTPSTLTSLAEENEVDKKGKKVETKIESDIKGFQHTQSTSMFLLATDLHLELDIIHHRASLKLLQLNAVAESELLDRIKKNKVSKALFLCQKALLVYNKMEPNNSSITKKLMEEASSLIEKAEVEERKLYFSTIPKPVAENKDKGIKEEDENPPPPPILLSRTDRSLTFAPAPYNLEAHVCWYQLCGRAAVGINQKVRLGDCSLPGTGHMVPVISGECVLKVEGLLPNQKYVFAVAAYNSRGKLLGNTIGRATFPLLASMPVPLLSAWAHLAQVAFKTEHYAIAKRACKELWSHYTITDPGTESTKNKLASTRLHKQTLRHSSSHLCQLFLTSIFTETEINIQMGLLYCDSFGDNGLFIWEQEARLAECERILLAMDLALWLNDGIAAVQAVVICYGLLAPLIFHQVTCKPMVQVLKKCLLVLEENSGHLKHKWTGNTLQSLMHMIACITYYLSKALRVLRENQMASMVMDCGRKLLQEVHDAQLQSVTVDHAAVRGEMKISLQLKALHVKNKKRITSKEVLTTDNDISHLFTGCEDPTILYDLISSSALKDTFHLVMKLRRKAYFTEYAALLLQRTMEEGHPDFVLKWGQSMFEFLSRRDEVMGLSTSRKRNSDQALKGNEPPQTKTTPPYDDTRKKVRQKIPHSMLQTMRTNRQMQAVENLITMLSSVVHRHKKQFQLRMMCCEERVWKAHLNYLMAQAHIALLYQGLDKLHGGAPQYRYSELNPLCFSLAYSGILVWRKSQRLESAKHEVVSERDSSNSGLRDYIAAYKNGSKNDVGKVDDPTDESYDEGEDFTQPVEQQTEMHKRTATLVLDSLNRAALHLRRAMVLAHRGSHWTILQCVCQTVWDHSCRISFLVQSAAHFELPSVITAEQLHTTITPLLVMATDLIMDMFDRLKLWSLYDSDLTEEELESSLQFSAPLDDSTQVDLRWVRTLVLHTLEQLHDGSKWESLAHFALLFNSYTRERYTLIITPLLVHAQRRLLERISSYGGPSVPQPHHVKTRQSTGKEVTYKSYAFCQLLSGWTRHSASQPPIRKRAAQGNATPRDAVELKGAEMKRSMSLVCVPLDLEDTLRCYREAFQKRSHSLQIFHHSRSLLLLFLAYTQPCFVTHLPHYQSRSFSRSTSLVDFNPIVIPAVDQLYDLTVEDFSTIYALYSFPISPDHMPTVIAAYATSIKHLQANCNNSLRVLALHEMGNIQFYNGNMRLAQSHWSKAVDCALQNSGTIEKWDGMSFGSGSLQQTLKQAGIWGCLQAAGLTAKIAQYVLTSDIIQRTKCCLLSAHLFKCVLCCSLAQPQADLQYASHSIRDELLPGVDLFSEPHRVHLDTTVTSLNFVCHWLYATGYHITLLPILALYLHFVGTVCRDVQRTVEGKILKIRALTELCLFTEAVKEAVQLAQGLGVLLPNGHYITKDNIQPMKMFYSSKSLLDNAEALEELLNIEIAPEICALYGSTLCLRLHLARIQLVLALSNTVHGSPAPDCQESCVNITSSVNSEQLKQDILDKEGPSLKTEDHKVLDLVTEKGKLNPERIKFHLLERASSLLRSVAQHLVSQCCTKMENLELEIEFNLLKANLYLQQGHAVLSSEMAVSSLVLLQTSPVITKRSRSGSYKLLSELPHPTARSKQDSKDWSTSNPIKGDCPREVEVSERMGVSLWLRCRLSLVRSLSVHIRTPASLFLGNNVIEEAARVIKEGLNECAQWGDLDIQALLMVEGAELEAHRGKTDDSMAMLQEAVSLLSGRTCMPPCAIVTLARATLLFSDLNGKQSTALLKLTQRLLQKQLCVFGQNVTLDDGQMRISSQYLSNIYLPHFSLLVQINLRITQNQ